jgi:hypothetical protein
MHRCKCNLLKNFRGEGLNVSRPFSLHCLNTGASKKVLTISLNKIVSEKHKKAYVNKNV